mgnify:CR=1 FL=1
MDAFNDVYYKQLKELIVANPQAQRIDISDAQGETTSYSTAQFTNDGEGTAWGAEFMVNKSLVDNWYGWFSLAYANTERKNKLTKSVTTTTLNT